MDHTRGKGPYARPSPSTDKSPRWSVPRVELTEEAIRTFLKFVRNRCDEGVFRLFSDLATMPPARRLARNASKLLSRMSQREVVDAIAHGLTDLENDALRQLSASAIPVTLLGVAHELLDIRKRQYFIPRLDESMDDARSLPVPFSVSESKKIERGQ